MNREELELEMKKIDTKIGKLLKKRDKVYYKWVKSSKTSKTKTNSQRDNRKEGRQPLIR